MYLSQGFAYNTKGYYQLAIESLLKAQRIFEDLNRISNLGYAALNLGITYGLSGRRDMAIEWSEKSVSYFDQINNQRAIAQILNNLGQFARDNEDWAKSAISHYRSIQHARETEQYDVVRDSYFNLAKMYKLKA